MKTIQKNPLFVWALLICNGRQMFCPRGEYKYLYINYECEQEKNLALRMLGINVKEKE